MQACVTRIIWIPIHAIISNLWHIETIRYKLEQLELCGYLYMQVNATNGIYRQIGASWCNQNYVVTYTCIQVQVYATNGKKKQLGTIQSKQNNVDTYTCKYMQPMSHRNNQVEASVTRIVWIHFHAFRYKHVLPMDAYTCIQVQVYVTNGIQKQLDVS